MSSTTLAEPPNDFGDSPLYLLATLVAARRSKDTLLEGVTRRRLAAIGVRIIFADALDAPTLRKPKGGRRHG